MAGKVEPNEFCLRICASARRLTAALLCLKNCRLFKHCVVNHRSFFGCVHYMNFAILRLQCRGISGCVAGLVYDVASVWIRLVVVGRNSNRKWHAFALIVVVVDEQQMSVRQLDEIRTGVWIRKLRVRSVAPGKPAIA